MTVHRGGKGKYLGMHLDFTEMGVFKVDMSSYIDGILEDFPEDIVNDSFTPHQDNLFTIQEGENAKPLQEEQAMQFHRTMARLLFLSTRARKDIQTAVSFLTTRVKEPSKEDWLKLR
eukprot:CCRYP_007505-RA/>CCRYP_007505-RA protein AED:0.39 eAED:0.39 QI:0/-1/0/1/-1/1/1/0/116